MGAVLWTPACAKTLVVGPDQELKAPSAAAAVASDGDTIEIAPGEYFDCAVWKVNHLTIEGKGAGAVITDLSCEGKALFVIRGNDITIRNLTFTRARVPDENGAGIRAEGDNLRIEGSHFINNESGILASNAPESKIIISDSEFTANGKCRNSCAHGLYVGHIAVLHVEHSKFIGTNDGHHIKSRALRTELIGDDIEDGPNGTSSYLVEIPNGGTLIMENNVLEKGPKTSNPKAAVTIGDENTSQPTAELLFRKNDFKNDCGRNTAFVMNWTGTEPSFADNLFHGNVTEVSSGGIWVHRIRVTLSHIIDEIKKLRQTLLRALSSTL